MVRARWLGRLAHADAVAAMEAARERVLDGDDGAETLMLCEHPPVITMGRRALREHVLATDEALAEAGVTLASTRRGGEVTYHGPGQLMVYPVVRLRAGLLPLLESIGAALAETIDQFGVSGAGFRRDPAGVWVGSRKVAACGVHLRRRVCIHGFALDVATPTAMWDLIVPCGLPGRPQASVATLSGRVVTVEAVAAVAGPMLERAVARGSTKTR